MLLINKLIKCLILIICVSYSIVFAFPSCPSAGDANHAVHQLSTLTTGTGPTGWLLYHSTPNTVAGFQTQYNYYATHYPSGKTPLDQIKYLSMFFTGPKVVTYTQNNIDYQQCIYYGSMVPAPGGIYVPTGDQVVTFQYSKASPPPAPIPLSLENTGYSLPSKAIVGTIYNLQYRLTNNNTTAETYVLSQLEAQGVRFITPTSDACNVGNQQATLAARSSCNIAINFDPSKVPLGNYNQLVLRLGSNVGVQPNQITFVTNVVKDLANNIIIFGDSLSDIGNVGTFTNNPPGMKNRIWIQDLIASEPENVDPHQVINSKKYNRSLRQGGLSPNSLNIDYAYGGALANNKRTLSVPGLLDQVLEYQKDLAGVPPNKNTLYFIWAGGNDLLTLLVNNPSQNDLNAAAQSAVQGIEKALQQLTKQQQVSPKQIVILNVPNLGSTPLVNILPIFVPRYASASSLLNSSLQTMLIHLYPDSANRPTVIDINSHLATLIKTQGQPGTPGANFTNVKGMCNVIGPAPSCTGFLFWDYVHPTTQAHVDLAKYIKDNL